VPLKAKHLTHEIVVRQVSLKRGKQDFSDRRVCFLVIAFREIFRRCEISPPLNVFVLFKPWRRREMKKVCLLG
jgi:hypothetical protein